jgi:acyl-CoA thioester hydrolase
MTRHRYDCHVRFSDVDVYGHVNNVKYFEYYQEARIAFIGSMGRGMPDADFGLVVAKVNVDYRRPILFRPAPYVIETWITRVGNSSFDVGSEIRDGDTVLSRAEATMATFDSATQRSRPLTDPERDLLKRALEG